MKLNRLPKNGLKAFFIEGKTYPLLHSKSKPHCRIFSEDRAKELLIKEKALDQAVCGNFTEASNILDRVPIKKARKK